MFADAVIPNLKKDGYNLLNKAKKEKKNGTSKMACSSYPDRVFIAMN